MPVTIFNSYIEHAHENSQDLGKLLYYLDYFKSIENEKYKSKEKHEMMEIRCCTTQLLLIIDHTVIIIDKILTENILKNYLTNT